MFIKKKSSNLMKKSIVLTMQKNQKPQPEKKVVKKTIKEVENVDQNIEEIEIETKPQTKKIKNNKE